MLSRSTFDVSKNLAPFREFGCFVVVIVTDSNSFFTDLSASNHDIAPEGRKTVFLNSLHASDIIS